MTTLRARTHAILFALLIAVPSAYATDVAVKDDSSRRETAVFPSDRFTVRDWSQLTGRRVSLPKPDCGARPSDCTDIHVLNALDGFSVFPRITIPFTGDIDPATVTSDTVFLVSLSSLRRIGINQRIWDPQTKILSLKPDEQLRQRARYLVVVTTGVKDSRGNPIAGIDLKSSGHRHDREYRHELRHLRHIVRGGVAGFSVFTTQTISADLERIVHAIKHTTPPAANFNIGLTTAGPVRAVFDVAGLTGIQWNRQVGSGTFSSSFVPTPALGVMPGAVGRVALASFDSPNYLGPDQAFAPVPSGEAPRRFGTSTLRLQLFVPAGAKPATGWPVILSGHGFTDSLYGAPWAVAAVFASRGFATLSISVVGHGGGAQGTINVIRNAGLPVQLADGGRGFDQNGDGLIESTEGTLAAPPRTLLGNRDALRQTAVDLAQVVRLIETGGVDIDGDGAADLDPRRIFYAGQSFGSIYGVPFVAVEPSIHAAAPNVGGGSVIEVARLGAFRVLVAGALAVRTPQLLNLPPTPGLPPPFNLNFNENMPLRNLPPFINNVPGAAPIQDLLENNDWAQQAANPVAYARFLRERPLRGNGEKAILLQFAKGDATVSNPTNSALIRAGKLEDRATLFRNDLVFAADPVNTPKNPHTFLTNIANATIAPFAVGAQTQIAVFFASGGATTIDPDGAGPVFEVPVTLPLPEGLGFIP